MKQEETKFQEQVLNEEQLDEVTGGCRGMDPNDTPPAK